MLNRQRAGRVTHVPRVEAVVCREATPPPGLTAPQKEQEMPHSTLDKVLADAQALSPEDQRRLRAKLDEWLARGLACRTEAEFEQQLVAQGVLSAVPPPITKGAPSRQRTRLQVHGTPLSETILEDRR